MTATCGRCWTISQKAWNYPDGVFLVSPWPQLSISTKSLLAKIWTKNSLLKFVFKHRYFLGYALVIRKFVLASSWNLENRKLASQILDSCHEPPSVASLLVQNTDPGPWLKESRSYKIWILTLLLANRATQSRLHRAGLPGTTGSVNYHNQTYRILAISRQFWAIFYYLKLNPGTLWLFLHIRS